MVTNLDDTKVSNEFNNKLIKYFNRFLTLVLLQRHGAHHHWRHSLPRGAAVERREEEEEREVEGEERKGEEGMIREGRGRDVGGEATKRDIGEV